VPFPATITIRGGLGQPVARVHTDAVGQFQVLVPPATYTLVTVPDDTTRVTLLGQPLTDTVTVVAGYLIPVAIGFDTGIR
jgi:hypothetical protein